MPKKRPHPDLSAQAQQTMLEDDGDEDIVFEEDEEEGTQHDTSNSHPFTASNVFGAGDYGDADVEVDIELDDEDDSEEDVPDPYGAVYANVRDETHMLKPVDNCRIWDCRLEGGE